MFLQALVFNNRSALFFSFIRLQTLFQVDIFCSNSSANLVAISMIESGSPDILATFSPKLLSVGPRFNL